RFGMEGIQSRSLRGEVVSESAVSGLDHSRVERRSRGASMAAAYGSKGTSLDGFIAGPNGDLDFLDEGGGGAHGYDEFMATVDALVIGRKTFETVLTFGQWPYGKKPVFVLSTRPVRRPLCRCGPRPGACRN